LRPGWTPPLSNRAQTLLENQRIVTALWGFAALSILAAHLRFRFRRAAPWADVATFAGAGLVFMFLGLVLIGGVSLYAFVTGVGCLELLARLRRGPLRTEARYFWIVFGAFFISTALWLPFDWTRYYLPVIVWSPVLSVAGIRRLLNSIGVERMQHGVRHAVSS
jgi:hypothetical protein